MRPVEVLAGRGGQEAEGEAGGAADRVVALTAWNFRMQQVVLCGLTPQVSVRVVRLANAGPAGAPLPVAIVVITPVCRSSMNSVRSDGTGMSPLSLGNRRVRIHTRYRPSTESDGWSSSSVVLTPAGTASLRPGARIHEPDLEPLAGHVAVVGGDQTGGGRRRRCGGAAASAIPEPRATIRSRRTSMSALLVRSPSVHANRT